ncbi:MAG TPA: hypothetical protein VGL18_10705 [Actinomycetota bacterium]|jgi:hypothetical protein
MIGSGVLDLVIGMFFVFLVFGLAVSGVNEAITRALEWRSRHLWRALRKLLDGKSDAVGDQRPTVTATSVQSWTDRLYAHPLVRQLEGRVPTSRSRLSRIPSTDFARAMIDLVAPDGAGATTVDQLRKGATELPVSSPIRAPLLAIISEAGDRLDHARQGIEDWFNGRMEALSRRYKRNTRWLLVVVGLVVALAFNVDAIGAAERLYRDEALRNAVAQQAASVVDACKGSANVASCTKTEVGKVDKSIRLPVGWPDPDGVGPLQLLGWLIAAVALGQGAPFWFDLLRKASKLRG